MVIAEKYKRILIIAGLVGFICLTAVSYVLIKPEAVAEEKDFSKTTTTLVVKDKFFIDVKGAVKKPGVYEFETGALVIDAVKKAGGLTKNGNTSNINLSQKLKDEMVVYIFTHTEIKKGSKKITCDTTCECETVTVDNCYNNVSSENNSGTQTGNKVNINKASLAELMTLSGIGESKAKAIIEYRNTNGPFSNIQDLTKVSGIGESTYDNLKTEITV